MKTLKFSIVIALCSVIIYGCSTKSAAPPHLVAVPNNAAVVLSFNAKQIVEKAELNNLKQYKFFSLLQRELNDVAEQGLMDDFLEDTRTSGLNLDHIVAYLAASDYTTKNMEPCFGVVFLIDDAKTFEGFLKKSGLDIENNSAPLFHKKTTLKWNDKIAVISRGADENSIDIFNEDASQSILANELFKKDYSDKNDVYLFFGYNYILDMFKEAAHYTGYYSPQSTFQILDSYKDMFMSININAEKGEFVAAGKMLPEKKANALFKQFYKTNFNKDLYQYFPDKSLMALKFAIKPLDTYNEYKAYLTGDNDVNRALEEYDEKITAVLGYFTGDVLGNLFEINLRTMSDFAIAAGITEGKETEVTALVKELGAVENPKGYYVVRKSNPALYFAVNKNVAYLTGNTASIEKFLADGYTPNIASAEDFGKELEGALSYFYWDVNIDHYPSMLKGLIELSSEGKRLMPLLKQLKSLNASTTGTNSFEFKLKFNDDGYASKTLLKGIDELVARNFR
jgi:hypothetical protein